jgi:hypothetical protein
MAILWAIMGGSLRSWESDVNLTSTGFFVFKSMTLIVFSLTSIEATVPAMFRNDPQTISSAANSLPSSLRVPRARS